MNDKQQKTKISIDNKDYIYEDMTDEQKILVNHVIDLTQKIDVAKFNLDQHTISKEAFMAILKGKLENNKEEIMPTPGAIELK